MKRQLAESKNAIRVNWSTTGRELQQKVRRIFPAEAVLSEENSMDPQSSIPNAGKTRSGISGLFSNFWRTREARSGE